MYPIMLDMSERSVLIVGGGRIAARKISGLLKTKAQVTVISPVLNDQIPLARVKWLARPYESNDVHGYQVILACTDDSAVNALIVSECQPWQLVNNTSQKDQSTFYNMATTLSDGIIYAVSTFGENPSRAKEAMNGLKKWLISKGK